MRAVDYLGSLGPLRSSVPGWEHRPSQLRMAESVQRIVEHGGVLLVEAGTGTGKTLAYLVPALLSEARVVVSTGTKTLQDQIMEHDLPLLEERLGLSVDAAVMKGLSNYLCLRRYGELRRSADADRGPVAEQLRVLEAWRERTESGDRVELDELPDDAAIWRDVASSSETRIGARCEHFDDCFVTRMRRRAEDAQLVVVNHHLYFADLATRGPRGGGIIPEHDVVIFDEAHQIEDVVTQFFGVHVSSTRVEVLARDALRALVPAHAGAESGEIVRSVLDSGVAFFQALPRSPTVESGRVPLPKELFSGELEARMLAFDSALEALASFAQRHVAESEAVAQIARRATQIRDDVALVAEGGRGRRVTFSEVRGRRASIGASPVDVSDLLREELFYRTRSVVLTSATLSTGGSFDFVKRRLGIDFEIDEEILDSPFDFAAQAALYVAAHLPDPRDGAYLAAAAQEIFELVDVTGGGAFVLCTSFRVMNELARRCAPSLPGPVLVQGSAPKNALLARFRAAEHAVLFATSSFWEGVDVPGDALRLVIIDKLPFDVPSDPLVAARCARLEETGEAPFMKYLVPSAALALKQGFGRLIRTRRDRGIVAILDNRIAKKGYGRVFLASLPPARRCETLDEVRAFYAGELGERPHVDA